MPLRGKKGQATITVHLKDGEEAIGHATAARAAAYYAAAYYVGGAGDGAGGRWCVALPGEASDFPAIALDQLEGLGVRPGQAWNAAILEEVLEGKGRRLGPEGKVRTHTWTFDLPKSFSALAAFGEDAWLTETIADAAQASMEFIAQTAKYVRRRDGDRIVSERGAGIHYSLVVERTARAALSSDAGLELTGVPSLHYHAHILIHYGVTKKGKLQAFDASDALLNGWRQLASATADLRVRVAAHERGYKLRMVEGTGEGGGRQEGSPPRWEVEGIPPTAIDALSERHRAIKSAEADGLSGLSAEMQTKAAKEPVLSWTELCAHWRRIIEDQGGEDPRTTARRGPSGGDGGRELLPPIGFGPTGGSIRTHPMIAGTLATTFAATPRVGWYSLVANFLQRVPGNADLPEARRMAALLLPQLLADGTMVALDDGSFTTRAIRDQEQRIADHWTVMSTPPPGVADIVRSQWAVKALRERTGVALDDDQVTLLEAARSQQATIAVGVAGSGKTATVEAIKLAGEATGQRVHILAVANLRALETRVASTAHAEASVAAFLWRAERGTRERHYSRGDLVVVDVASQLRDDDLEVILRESRRMGLGVVLLGDTHQQAAIGRGAMFGELVRRGRGVVELKTAHRFRDPAQAVALARLREREAAPWVEYASERGWLKTVVGPQRAARTLAEMYVADRELLVLTLGSNERRDEINAEITGRLVALGEISPVTTAVQADVRSTRTVDIHQGSRIRINQQLFAPTPPPGTKPPKNGRRDGRKEWLWAKNGEVASVRAIDKRASGDQIRLTFEDGRDITVPASTLVATHAYALGGYKATGATSERVALDWADGQARQAVYPAVSRQRDSLQVVVSVGTPEEVALGTEGILEKIQDSVGRSSMAPASVSVEEATAEPAIARELRVAAVTDGPALAGVASTEGRLFAEALDMADIARSQAERREALVMVPARQAERERAAVQLRQLGHPEQTDQLQRSSGPERTADGFGSGRRPRSPMAHVGFVEAGEAVSGTSAQITPLLHGVGFVEPSGEVKEPAGGRFERGERLAHEVLSSELTPSTAQGAGAEKARGEFADARARLGKTLEAGIERFAHDAVPAADREQWLAEAVRMHQNDLQRQWRAITFDHGIIGTPMPEVDVPGIVRGIAAAELGTEIEGRPREPFSTSLAWTITPTESPDVPVPHSGPKQLLGLDMARQEWASVSRREEEVYERGVQLLRERLSGPARDERLADAHAHFQKHLGQRRREISALYGIESVELDKPEVSEVSEAQITRERLARQREITMEIEL